MIFITTSNQLKIRQIHDEVPEEIKQTYEKLGIPEAERSYLQEQHNTKVKLFITKS